jgi:hypothetical protein
MTQGSEFRSARRWLWLGGLSAASAAFSVALACAMPFAALAAFAAGRLSRRDGLLVMAGAWAANQAVGFLLLDYPATSDSIAWGAALLLAALLAAGAAGLVAGRRPGWRALAAGFAAAFAAYEGALFAASFLLPGGETAFALPVMAEILAVNAAALAGLALLQQAAERFGVYPQPQAA